MAYVLQAILAGRLPAAALATALPDTRAVDLTASLAIVPVTAPSINYVLPGARRGRTWLIDGEPLPDRLDELLKHASAVAAVAYVEAEFFGGDGAQGSLVYERGQVVLGPLIDPPEFWLRDRSPGEPGPPLSHLPINRALRRLGIDREAPACDEFDTVGLGRHRRTEDWLAAG